MVSLQRSLRALFLPGQQGLIWSLAIKVWDKSRKDHLFIHAASLAFTSVLSLIPMLALAYFLFDAFGGLDKLQGDMESFILSNLAPAFGSDVSKYINAVRGQISAGALGIFGVFGFMYTSFSMLSKIEYSLNHIWGVGSRRAWIRKVTDYWAMITLGPVLIGLSLYLSASAVAWLKNDHGEISKLLLILFALIPYVMSAILFSAVYLIMPGFNVPKKSALISGAIAAFVFEVAKNGYAYYAARTLGKSVYGSLAILPVFLVWLQWVWIIVLFGAELCFQLAHGIPNANESSAAKEQHRKDMGK